MNKFRSILCGVLVIGAAVAPLPADAGSPKQDKLPAAHQTGARPAATDPSGWQSCPEANTYFDYGNFVCYDPGNGSPVDPPSVTIFVGHAQYGAVLFASGTTPMVPARAWPPSRWIYASSSVTYMLAPLNNSILMYSQDQALGACGPTNNCISMTAAGHDLLEWFSNDPSFWFVRTN